MAYRHLVGTPGRNQWKQSSIKNYPWQRSEWRRVLSDPITATWPRKLMATWPKLATWPWRQRKKTTRVFVLSPWVRQRGRLSSNVAFFILATCPDELNLPLSRQRGLWKDWRQLGRFMRQRGLFGNLALHPNSSFADNLVSPSHRPSRCWARSLPGRAYIGTITS